MSRVLVIDGDTAVRTAVKAVLEGRGYDVVVAEDGRSGIAAVETTQFAAGPERTGAASADCRVKPIFR